MTRAAVIAAAVAALISACDGASRPADAALPDDPSAECALASVDAAADGSCVARWSCRADGLHTLSCGGSEGGAGCICVVQGMSPITIAARPGGCSDAEPLAAFARAQCGWPGL